MKIRAFSLVYQQHITLNEARDCYTYYESIFP